MMTAFVAHERDNLPFRCAQHDDHGEALNMNFAEGQLTPLPYARSFIVPWQPKAE